MLPNCNGLASTIVVVVLLTSKYAAHGSSASGSLVHTQSISFFVRRLRDHGKVFNEP